MKARIFYGWYVLAAAFVVLFLSTGTHLSFGVMLKPMAAEFGWDRGAISSVYFLNMTVLATSMVFIGRLYDRIGPRPILTIGALLLTLGYSLTANVSALWQLYISYGVIVALGIGGTSVPLISAIIAKWFVKRRGMAASLTISGASIGQFVLVPLLTSITVEYDWRTAYLTVAAMMFVVITALGFLVIREPGDMGLQAYGSDTESRTGEPIAAPSSGDVSIGHALRTRSYWLFLVSMIICGGADFAVMTHFVPLVTDNGMTPTMAGRMLALFGLTSLAGLLLAGPVADVIGNKIPMAFAFAVRLLLFVLILNWHSSVAFYVFAVGFGITFLITAPITPTLLGKLYGLTHIGVTMGFVMTFHHLAGGLWTYVGGEIYDRTGSYDLMFLIFACLAAVALTCVCYIKDEHHDRSGEI